MGNVVSIEPLLLQTSAGIYQTILGHVDDNFPQTGSYSLRYNTTMLKTLNTNFFCYASACVLFTIGPDFEVYIDNGNYKARYKNHISSNLGGSPAMLPFFVEDQSGRFSVWGYTGEAMYDMNLLGYQAQDIITPVTSSSFGVIPQHYDGWYNTGLNFPAQEDFANYLLGYQPVQYHWQSWAQLSGNNGQFSAAMTKLKSATLTDISPFTYKVLSASDFDTLAGESSIWNTYLNAMLGVPYTIAYSGNNYLTLTVTNHLSDTGIKIFTFNFYLAGSGAPFATVVEEVITGGENPALITWDYFLSFLYDSTEEAAVFYAIEYTPNNSLVKYKHQVMAEWSEVTMQNMYTWLQGTGGSPSGSGPYDTGTTDNGGTPSGTGHQDPMPNVHVPTLSGASSGMFTIYCPDDTELGQIATFLWSDNVLDNFKKYFNNFSDNIIALYVLPYKPANLPTKAFTVGNLTSETITAVDYVTTRFVSVDMGEITVGTRWDSYLDFEPYTKFNVYLPGIGVQALSADDIICPANMDESMPEARGSKIALTYVVDLMTGNVAAYVKINGQIRYQFTGKVGYSIPITGANYNSLVQGYVMATAGLIGTLATGGTAAPFAASAGAAGIINAMKPDVYRGGNLSGDSSAMCLEYPYLIRRRPNKPYLNEQEIYTGFPSYKSGLLSEFSGFTQVLDAHIDGISCTEAERAEILQLLKSGVII